MRRPHRLLLALVAGLSIAGGPATAAGAEPDQETFLAFSATSTNWTGETEPGSFRRLSISAIAGTQPNPYQGQACIEMLDWTVTPSEVVYERLIQGCSAFDTLGIADDLRSGHLVATVAVQDCREQTDQRFWSQCTTASVEVDLTMAGAGPVRAIRDGFRFEYPAGGQSIYVMRARARDMDLSGDVSLGAESLLLHPWQAAEVVVGATVFVTTPN